jgi:hypothetical protein
MILDDVAQATGAFVKGTATLDTEILGQGDLHTGHVVTVPDWLQK